MSKLVRPLSWPPVWPPPKAPTLVTIRTHDPHVDHIGAHSPYKQLNLKEEFSLLSPKYHVGDIFVEEEPAIWGGKKVLVVGWDGGSILGCIDENRGYRLVNGKPMMTGIMYAQDSENFLLLERPGWKYRVGDKFRFAGGTVATIRVMNPEWDEEDNQAEQYLIEFDVQRQSGEPCPLKDKHWFPISLRNRDPRLGRFQWCQEKFLDDRQFLGNEDDGQQSEMPVVVVPKPKTSQYRTSVPKDWPKVWPPRADLCGGHMIELFGALNVESDQDQVTLVDVEQGNYHYLPGDLIRGIRIIDENADTELHLVAGVQYNDIDILWCLNDTSFYIDTNLSGCSWATKADGLFLVERPGWKYIQGDRFRLRDGRECTVRVLNPEAVEVGSLRYMVEYTPQHGVTPQTHGMDHYWFPKRLKDKSRQGGYWWHTEAQLDEFEYVDNTDGKPKPPIKIQPALAETKTGVTKDNLTAAAAVEPIVIPKNKEDTVMAGLPEWVMSMAPLQKAGISHVFIVTGNVFDEFTDSDGKAASIFKLLARMYGQRNYVIYYSMVGGISLVSGDEKTFRETYLVDQASVASAQTAAARVGATSSKDSPFHKIGYGDFEDALPVFGRLLEEKPIKKDKETAIPAPKKALFLDFSHHIFRQGRNGSSCSTKDFVIVEAMLRWARDKSIGAAGNTIILLAPSITEISNELTAATSRISIIRVPRPDESARKERWSAWMTKRDLVVNDGLTADVLSRTSNGMTLVQIDDICNLALCEKRPLSFDTVRKKKQEMLQNEFGNGVVEVKSPQYGFEAFGGREELKKYLLEVKDNILSGNMRRVPMGLLASGPPGTGKTFLFECWAKVCGFNFVTIKNPRSMWLGQSETIMARIFEMLESMAPVIVVEDEADQSEMSRDSPSGDSGVSSRLRQMKFMFCSDPKNRGRVVWVRITNRDDLMDAAYKRKGRTDDNIPFVLPGNGDYERIFEVMFKRYEIPHKINDFSSLAELVKSRVYCTGADLEWMVLEADKFAGRQKRDVVTELDLKQAIEDWEMDLNPDDVDHQIILAIRGSSKRLRPVNWERLLADAENRIKARHGLLPPVTNVPESRRPSEFDN